jgi:hypothetical protein
MGCRICWSEFVFLAILIELRVQCVITEYREGFSCTVLVHFVCYAKQNTEGLFPLGKSDHNTLCVPVITITLWKATSAGPYFLQGKYVVNPLTNYGNTCSPKKDRSHYMMSHSLIQSSELLQLVNALTERAMK